MCRSLSKISRDRFLADADDSTSGTLASAKTLKLTLPAIALHKRKAIGEFDVLLDALSFCTRHAGRLSYSLLRCWLSLTATFALRFVVRLGQ